MRRSRCQKQSRSTSTRPREKTGQTMLEYVTESSHNLRELAKYKIELPDEAARWLIQTTVGTKTTVKEVEKALYLTLGQDHKLQLSRQFLKSPMRRWRQGSSVHYAGEDAYFGEEYEGEDEEAYYEWASEEAGEEYGWDDEIGYQLLGN